MFILVGIALIAAAIKYPKDFFVRVPLAIITSPFKVIWFRLVSILDILIIPFSVLVETYKSRDRKKLKQFEKRLDKKR